MFALRKWRIERMSEKLKLRNNPLAYMTRRVADLKKKFAESEKLSEERRKKLECLEWSGERSGSQPKCPSCRNAMRQGHAPDCKLARLVKK